MYAAYAQAATTTDALRDIISTIHRWHNYKHEALPPVVLPDAPKIMMVWRTATYPSVTLPVLLFGVAPAKHIEMSENLQFHEEHELFTPSLTDGQATAIAQMLNTLKDDYWIREAHANGITDNDDIIRQWAKRNRDELAVYYHDPTPAYWMVGFEIAYVLIVFVLIGVLAFHSHGSSLGGSMPTVVPGTHTTPIRPRAETHNEERASSREEEERQQRQQERINRRLNEERQRAARPKEQEVPSGAPSPSSDTLAEHFATLGIPVDATDEQIKTAYRDLAMVWHPDRFGDGDTRLKKKAEEQFKTIHAAYTYLQEYNPRPPIVSDIEKMSLQKNEDGNTDAIKSLNNDGGWRHCLTS